VKALLLTNEYPPHIYGGAGVHVEYLARELAALMDVEVRCFGDQSAPGGNPVVRGFQPPALPASCPAGLGSVFGALGRCLDFNTTAIDADVAHCHTWYAHFGGILAKLNYGVPLVATVHSLEPLRPWKREQLGGGYDFTCWLEKTTLEMADAVIAVSEDTRRDVERLFDIDPSRIHIIHNGIDPVEFREVRSRAALERHGIDPGQPYILFLGRITRQKGIIHLVNAIRHLDPGFQIVLCAGAPDTPAIAAEMEAAVAEAKRGRDGIFWISEMLDKESKVEFYSHAALFVCPSIYEPFGIINLEAMACGRPVVASAVGGIPEVVEQGETGLLVPVEQMGVAPFEPVDAERFSRDLAVAINELMADPARRSSMGEAGMRRAAEVFSWSAIAKKTKALYEKLAG
jgi:alpha-maltose-1-phosphate synthase